MRIAVVSPRYPAAGAVGGCETLLASLAHHAADRGHDVHFLTTCATNHFSWDNAIQPGKEVRDGLAVHYFPVNPNRDIQLFLSVQEQIDQYLPVPEERQQACDAPHASEAVVSRRPRTRRQRARLRGREGSPRTASGSHSGKTRASLERLV